MRKETWIEVILDREHLAELRQILASRFNEPELRDLCFDLGIDYGSLPGEGAASKARELVAHCKRHECIPELVVTVKRTRPDIRWNVIHVPLVGPIAGGEPLQILDGSTEFPDAEGDVVEITEDMLGNHKDVFALRVNGRSMNDWGIGDGDIAVMKRQDWAENGDIVAVRTRDENEVTLKRFYLEGRQVRLQPASASIDPICIPADNVDIQAKLILVIRVSTSGPALEVEMLCYNGKQTKIVLLPI